MRHALKGTMTRSLARLATTIAICLCVPVAYLESIRELRERRSRLSGRTLDRFDSTGDDDGDERSQML
jgi:hypothetical protein